MNNDCIEVTLNWKAVVSLSSLLRTCPLWYLTLSVQSIPRINGFEMSRYGKFLHIAFIFVPVIDKIS